jgi:ribosomal-protein-alanine N-acetyltransferase
MMWLFPSPRVIVDEPAVGEVDILADLHAEAFARGWSAEDFAALMAGDNVFALTARRESLFGLRRIAGFVVVRIAADEAEVLTIAVGRARRGRGYGRLLMEEALRRLYRERIAACFLEVNRDNDPAVALYRGLGFEDVGTRKGYYGSVAGSDGTAIVMRLALASAGQRARSDKESSTLPPRSHR